jgi:F0F1-type ATP synthase membrane subunit c/vacuolar-type H+-ATPase subunit K
MKKTILVLPLMLILMLMSCKKTEYVANPEDAFDLKASKMEQVGSMFEAIARQPEAYKVIINASKLSYANYTELLPLSDKNIVQRGKARGFAFSMLFNAIARQPEAYHMLDSAATIFLGAYNPQEISDELLSITKTYSVSALDSSIARQPEAFSSFNLVCQKFLNFEIPLAKK